MSNSITKNFIKGLELYDLTLDDIINSGWKYCGGDTGRHLNYYKIAMPNKKIPEKIHHCVCGHYIMENCYITNKKYMLTLGNCCIKRFCPKSGRTCEICGEGHKNRLDNKCKKCRIRIEKNTVKTCIGCFCVDECHKVIDKKFQRCWTCNRLEMDRFEESYHERLIDNETDYY